MLKAFEKLCSLDLLSADGDAALFSSAVGVDKHAQLKTYVPTRLQVRQSPTASQSVRHGCKKLLRDLVDDDAQVDPTVLERVVKEDFSPQPTAVIHWFKTPYQVI